MNSTSAEVTLGAGIHTAAARFMFAAMRPVDGASAAAFRIAFGMLAFVAVVRFFVRGWIGQLYVEPVHHLHYFGFGWVQPWPAWGMYAHFAALAVPALCIAAGYRYRLSVSLFFLGFTYVELMEATTYLNHYYWVSVVSLLMVFMPLNSAASVDAMRGRVMRPGAVPAWVIWTLRFQIAVVYVFAGIAKLNPDWMIHALPLRIWLSQSGDLPILGPLLAQTWSAYGFSWVGAAFDLTIPFWLMWSRSRPLAYAAVVVFHTVTWVLFPAIGMFPWLMIAATLVFFPPDWPRTMARLMPISSLLRLLSSLPLFSSSFPRKRESSAPRQQEPLALSWRTGVGLACLGLFALAQVAVPLRHLAYPGNVRWTEEGYRHSWRVMLTEKTGLVQYRVTDTETGRQWVVSPEEVLTPAQTERMAIQPDLILQTAHIVADEFEGRGIADVEVRADAYVAFNGRPNARLIDPDVDLASLSNSVMPKSWILPAPPYD